MEIKSYGKINLGLQIISKRDDSFHNIETILYPVKLSVPTNHTYQPIKVIAVIKSLNPFSKNIRSRNVIEWIFISERIFLSGVD